MESSPVDRAEWKHVADEFDPWGESGFEPTDDDPPSARPNWWIAAVAGLSMLVLVLLVLLVVNRDDSPDIEPAGPIVETTTTASTSPSTTAGSDTSAAAVDTISAVEIDQTVEPTECVGATEVGDAPLEAFLNAALSQQGTPYEYGARTDASDANPAAFDTSELVKWSARRAGVEITDGSWLQYLSLLDCGGTIVVDQALQIPGALLFGFKGELTREERPEEAFVAISLGDGERIIDVREGQGVAIYEISPRSLTHAALIPDLGQGTAEYLP